ncbi:hypothetical protein NXV10_00300 [Bacteroides thetaiotaomicron]|nr:hypothetical protein [Bacteroides thetaiotaomicron]
MVLPSAVSRDGKSQGVVREFHRAFPPRCLHQPAGQPVGVGLVGVASRGV